MRKSPSPSDVGAGHVPRDMQPDEEPDTDYYCSRCALRFGTRASLVEHQVTRHGAPRGGG